MAKTPPENENRPVHTVRHRSLKATIWRNVTDKGTLFNVTITRSYRDKETGQWRDTQSLGYDDLMNVAALMYEAHSYISSLSAKPTARPKPAANRHVPRAGTRPAASASSEEELPY